VLQNDALHAGLLNHFEKRRCDLGPFNPRNTDSVTRRLETDEEGAQSSSPSRARFRFELDRVYGGWERSSSGSGSSKLSRNAGGRYGRGLGANNGALHTTWRNSGAGVNGAAVDIGDPGSEGETVVGSSAGIGREMGSAGSAVNAGSITC